MPQVKPATHESEGHFYYHPRPEEPYDGLDPYWFVGDLVINHFDGHRSIETTIDGETFHLDLAYSKSGFAPRLEDDVEGRLYEWELHLEGYGERKCHFNLSPRFPDVRHHETGEQISLAFDHLDAPEGVTVQYQSSNIDLDRIPGLLRRALEAFTAAAGTNISQRYFDAPKDGVINALERYVRITRDMNRKLIEDSALMNRIEMLLCSEGGTKGKRTWDNTEAKGYHHQVIFGPDSAEKLIPHHHRGRQLKSYLMKHPDNLEPDDPLYHPKFGVLFKRKLNDGAAKWTERHKLIERLDETIINVLSWADIPVTVGGDGGGGNGAFIPDDHFRAQARDDAVPILEDPTPRLEAEQDHLLMTILRDMTTSDAEIVETVATDGGQPVEDVAETSGYSLSTIYRALQRLDGLLQSEQGHIKFASRKIAEEIRAIVKSAEQAVESAADRVATLFDVEINQRSESAVSNWLAEYGGEFQQADANGPGKIRIDTVMAQIKSSRHPYLPRVLDYLVHAWINDGRGRVNINNVLVEAELRSGERVCAPVKALR